MKKVYQRREKCIGCAYCVSIAPGFWAMNERDGKCDLLGSHLLKKEHVLEIFEDEVEQNRKAAEICPTNCIRIE
ncbi:ferredoxin [Marinifilum caeruleilacunae]|uniref:Ferredoxin n=1 Tax=Marinifilum caeruleilacunae TaxID=2499076 RepID=A0ABX1X0T8_9BACT|nr:ferredoxin [Marinifilum caeruleilacunae]NOU61685.1 ferredoxin [Marinifilum caeruleilacunae]